MHYVNANWSETKTRLEQNWGLPSARQLGKLIYAKKRPFRLRRKKIVEIKCPIKCKSKSVVDEQENLCELNNFSEKKRNIKDRFF
jgi:hypothetical protein